MKNLQTFETFSFYGFIPFNDPVVVDFETELIKNIEKIEIKYSNVNGGTFILMKIGGYNLSFVYGTYSKASNMNKAVALGEFSGGINKIYMVLLNDKTDDAIFISKSIGKQLVSYFENYFDIDFNDTTIGSNSNISTKRNLTIKIEYLTDVLKNKLDNNFEYNEYEFGNDFNDNHNKYGQKINKTRSNKKNNYDNRDIII